MWPSRISRKLAAPVSCTEPSGQNSTWSILYLRLCWLLLTLLSLAAQHFILSFQSELLFKSAVFFS